MLIGAYGERPGDGRIQISFSLPVNCGPAAEAAASLFCAAMNLTQVQIVHQRALDEGLTFFVIYATAPFQVPVVEAESSSPTSEMSRTELEAAVQARFGRKLVVIGACTGTDAHTVGLDAILSAKGYAGEPGLEAYAAFEVHNLGSQVSNEEAICAAEREGADALLISQVITHNDIHRRNLNDLAIRLRGLEKRLVVIIGGPRVGPELAAELGFDAAFGAGATPHKVAARLVELISARDGFNG